MGLLKNLKLHKNNEQIKHDIAELEAQNRALRLEIDNLKNNTRYMEKIAREELNMSREDEITFIFPEKKGKEENGKGK